MPNVLCMTMAPNLAKNSIKGEYPIISTNPLMRFFARILLICMEGVAICYPLVGTVKINPVMHLVLSGHDHALVSGQSDAPASPKDIFTRPGRGKR